MDQQALDPRHPRRIGHSGNGRGNAVRPRLDLAGVPMAEIAGPPGSPPIPWLELYRTDQELMIRSCFADSKASEPHIERKVHR